MNIKHLIKKALIAGGGYILGYKVGGNKISGVAGSVAGLTAFHYYSRFKQIKEELTDKIISEMEREKLYLNVKTAKKIQTHEYEKIPFTAQLLASIKGADAWEDDEILDAYPIYYGPSEGSSNYESELSDWRNRRNSMNPLTKTIHVMQVTKKKHGKDYYALRIMLHVTPGAEDSRLIPSFQDIKNTLTDYICEVFGTKTDINEDGEEVEKPWFPVAFESYCSQLKDVTDDEEEDEKYLLRFYDHTPKSIIEARGMKGYIKAATSIAAEYHNPNGVTKFDSDWGLETINNFCSFDIPITDIDGQPTDFTLSDASELLKDLITTRFECSKANGKTGMEYNKIVFHKDDLGQFYIPVKSDDGTYNISIASITFAESLL